MSDAWFYISMFFLGSVFGRWLTHHIHSEDLTDEEYD